MKKLFLTFCSTFALASLVSVFSNNGSAYANQPCTGKQSIGYECYEDGVINARTDYGTTQPFNGQINAGAGFVITRVEFINESQFGSVSGPNIRKIQSGASVEIANILNQTSRLAEEVYNKARAEYKNLKYMIEIQDKLTKEMNTYRNYLSRVQSNVDTVEWDGKVSGRCTRYILSRCVDSIGGKLQGKVRVHKLYIGSRGEYKNYAQSVNQRLNQALALTREANKPVEQPSALSNVVVSSYQAAFGRTPTQEELNYWLGRSRQESVNMDMLMVNHRNWLKGGNEINETIVRSYQAILSRSPKEDEINYWRSRISTDGLTYTDLIRAHQDWKSRGGT